VLGTEELMFAPLQLAVALADVLASDAVATDGPRGSGAQVRYSTTTRSPVLAVDADGYAIRTALTFPAHDVDPTEAPASGDPRFVYNVGTGLGAGAERFDAIVLVVDAVGDTGALAAPGGLLDVLARVTDDLLLVVLPDAAAHRARRLRADGAA